METKTKQSLLFCFLALTSLLPPRAEAVLYGCDCCPCPCWCECETVTKVVTVPTTSIGTTTSTPLPPATTTVARIPPTPPPVPTITPTDPPSTTTATQCEDRCLDLGFMLDGSGSILQADYDKVLDFITGVVNQFKISTSLSQTALVQFGSAFPPLPGNPHARVEWDFADSGVNADVASVETAVGALTKFGGFTYMVDGYDFYLNDVVPTRRMTPPAGCSEVIHAVVVFTDGQVDKDLGLLPDRAQQLLTATNNLVFGVAIGNESEGTLNETNLAMVAGDMSRVTILDDYDALASQIDDFVDELCDMFAPTAIPTTTQAPATTTTEGPEECPDVCLDLGIIIDGSATISSEDWIAVEEYFADLVESFNVGPTMLQTAVVQFGSRWPPIGPLPDARVEWGFDGTENTDKDTLLTAIDDLSQFNGFTYMVPAFNLYLDTVLPTRTRTDCEHVVVIFTDGQVDKDTDLLPGLAAQLLASTGGKVYGLGVGSVADGTLNQTQLEMFTGDPSRVFTFDDYTALKDHLPTLVDNICPEVTTTVAPTTSIITTTTTADPTTTTVAATTTPTTAADTTVVMETTIVTEEICYCCCPPQIPYMFGSAPYDPECPVVPSFLEIWGSP